MKSLIAQTQTDIVAVEPIDAGSRLYKRFLQVGRRRLVAPTHGT